MQVRPDACGYVNGWGWGGNGANSKGCKWVCGWVDMEERPTHKELTGLSGWDAGNWLKNVDGWKMDAREQWMQVSVWMGGRVGGQWMQVRMGASGWSGWVASLEILSHEAMIEMRAQVVEPLRYT